VNPVPLPQIVNGNAVVGRQRFSFNLCHISKTPTFQILIRPWEHKKVARTAVGRLGVWVGVKTPFCFWPKGRRFADVAEAQRELLRAVENISVEEFRQRFQQWERRWDRCIQSLGTVL